MRAAATAVAAVRVERREQDKRDDTVAILKRQAGRVLARRNETNMTSLTGAVLKAATPTFHDVHARGNTDAYEHDVRKEPTRVTGHVKTRWSSCAPFRRHPLCRGAGTTLQSSRDTRSAYFRRLSLETIDIFFGLTLHTLLFFIVP